MHTIIDLRSDTVTRPTPAMREAMARAEVGDDVYGEDPTVNRLQEVAARMVGTEAALFVPTGSMGNEVAIGAWTRPGDEVLIDEDAHIVKWELGSAAILSGVQTRTVPNHKGIVPVDALEARIQPGDDHSPRTALICLETSHNASGGVAQPLSHLAAVSALAKAHKIPVHLDGARIFNAALALGVPASRIVAHVDSVMFCLSKGLCCPVGSLVCGSRDFIGRARRVRRIFGGAMRQAGVLAAPGLVALDSMIERLADDHRRARHLAEALSALPGLSVDLETVQTNLVYVRTEAPAETLVSALAAEHVLASSITPHVIRLVTHHDVDDEDIERALACFARLLKMPVLSSG